MSVDAGGLSSGLEESTAVQPFAKIAPEFLAQLTAERGVDEATRWLYRQLMQSPQHRPAIERLDHWRRQPAPGHSLAGVTCAVAPGAFYREFRDTGADGRLLQEAAQRFGCQTALIPAASTGTLEENADAILHWLREHAEEPVILASVSKGGSDIKTALARPGAAEAFRPVKAWISVCGILDGSPMVNWQLARPLRTAFYRLLFAWRGYNFGVIENLRHGPETPLAGELRLPAHVQMVHVIGFPLTEHMTNRFARTLHGRIAPLGPNDGAILLSDVCRWPGVIYPVWGADHYLRPSWELRSLAQAVFAYLAEQFTSTEGGR